MSEVKRISVFMHGPNKKVDMVEAAHLDRVTAERDAALGREAALREELSIANGCLSEWRRSTLGRTLLENAALQQRLTAADERADLLEALLRDVSGRGRVVNWELGLMDEIDDALKDFCQSCNGAGWANQGCVDLCATCAGSGMTARK